MDTVPRPKRALGARWHSTHCMQSGHARWTLCIVAPKATHCEVAPDKHDLLHTYTALCDPCHDLSLRGVSGRSAAAARMTNWQDGGPCGVCGARNSSLWRRASPTFTSSWLCQACVVLGDAGDDNAVLEEHDGRSHTLQRVNLPPSSAAEPLVRVVNILFFESDGRARHVLLCTLAHELRPSMSASRVTAFGPPVGSGEQRGAAMVRLFNAQSAQTPKPQRTHPWRGVYVIRLNSRFGCHA